MNHGLPQIFGGRAALGVARGNFVPGAVMFDNAEDGPPKFRPRALQNRLTGILGRSLTGL